MISFPGTASAGLGSSGFAGKKKENDWRLKFELFCLLGLFVLLFLPYYSVL